MSAFLAWLVACAFLGWALFKVLGWAWAIGGGIGDMLVRTARTRRRR